MNQLNFILSQHRVPEILAAKFWIKAGSSADPMGQRGAHQLLGSLLNRGCGPYNNKELADLVEGSGASLRCDIHEDGLLISLKCVKSDALTLLPILGWMVINPHLESKQIDIERELSLQSLQRQKESPFHLAFDGWRLLAYGDGPYGHDPLGVTKDLQKLSKQELLPLAKNLLYTKQILSIAGDLPKDLQRRIIESEPFKELMKIQYEKTLPIDRPTKNAKSEKYSSKVSLHPQETEQVVVLIGQPTIPHNHKDDLALRLLSCHLGSGMSSFLFRKLREEHGVAYDVGIHYPAREKASPFLLHASTSEEKASLTIKLLNDALGSITEAPLSPEDLLLAKAKFRGQMAHSLQTVSQHAERNAQLSGLGLENDFDKKSLLQMESLTSVDLQKAAITHLKNPLLSLCGPEATINKLSLNWEN